MVQRKVGIKAEHLKNHLIKPSSSSQYLQQAKSTTSDFKKMMKKSKSVQLSDHTESESSRSSPPTKSSNVKQPNYMRPTSSSDARNKPEITITRSSSLKSVRSLTKAPSFKPSRGRGRAYSTSKSSKMAMCADMQKATCSSTLKDSKFPNYVALNPGGTQSQGTSVTRVCTYTYCSLNGHHRPPLKIFLKAKRRSIKTHKSIKKMEACRAKSPGDEDMDLCVEIYATEKQDDGGQATEIDFEQKVEDVDEEYGFTLAREDASFWLDIDLEREEGTSSETTDMEWDEGEFPIPELAKQVLDSFQIENISDPEADEVVQEVIEDESGCFEIQFDDSDLEADQGILQNPENEAKAKATQASNNKDSENCSVCIQTSDEDNIVTLKEEEREDEIGEANGIQASSSTQVSSDADQDTAKADDVATEEISASQLTTDQKESEQEFANVDDVATEESSSAQVTIDQRDSEQELTNVDVGGGMEAKDEIGEANGIQISSSTQGSSYADQDTAKASDVATEESSASQDIQVSSSTQGSSDADLYTAKADNVETEESSSSQVTTNDSFPVEHAHPSAGQDLLEQQVIEDQIPSSECCAGEADELEAQDSEEIFPAANNTTIQEDATDGISTRKWRIGCRKAIEDCEKEGEFNPREPNYLPLVADPEAEKVDLRHQMMDERKNADEWMLDYALRQTVTKLAPARNRKVALLVEAFEAVLPVPKYKPPIKHHSAAAFTHTRPIQACK